MASLCTCRDCYNTAMLEGLDWLMKSMTWREWLSAYSYDWMVPSVFSYSRRPLDVGRLLPFEEWQQMQMEGENAVSKKV